MRLWLVLTAVICCEAHLLGQQPGKGSYARNIGGHGGACNPYMRISPNPITAYQGDPTHPQVNFFVDKFGGDLDGDSIQLSHSVRNLPHPGNFNIWSKGEVDWGDGSSKLSFATEPCVRPSYLENGGAYPCLTSTNQTLLHTYTQSGRFEIDAYMLGDFKHNTPDPSGSEECRAEQQAAVIVLPTHSVSGTVDRKRTKFISSKSPHRPLKIDNPQDLVGLKGSHISSNAYKAYIDESTGTIHFILAPPSAK